MKEEEQSEIKSIDEPKTSKPSKSPSKSPKEAKTQKKTDKRENEIADLNASDVEKISNNKTTKKYQKKKVSIIR